MLQADPLQHLERLALLLRRRHAEHARHERDVLEHGLVRDQLEVLEHEAERAAVGLHLARRQRREIAAADDEPPFGRQLLAEQQPQQRRLAGAARAGQEHELAFVDAQRQLAQRVHAAAVQLRELAAASITRCAFAQRDRPSTRARTQLVDARRVRLARRRLHDLADEEAERLASCRRDTAATGAGVRREHLGDDAIDARPRRRSARAPRRRRCRRRGGPTRTSSRRRSLAIGPLIVPLSIEHDQPGQRARRQRRVLDRRRASRSACARARPSPSCSPPSGCRRRPRPRSK